MIGWEAEREDIALGGSDLIFSRTSDLGNIPANTVVELIWEGGPMWPASVSGAVASWRLESTAHATIADGTAFTIWVRYPNGLTGTKDDYEWIKGFARRELT